MSITENNNQSLTEIYNSEMEPNHESRLTLDYTTQDATSSHNSNESVEHPFNNTTAKLSMQDDGNSTDALADAFSSSLANIAAAGRITNPRNYYRHSTITNSDTSHTTTTTTFDRNTINNQSSIQIKNLSLNATSTNTSSSSDDRCDSSEKDGIKQNIHDYSNYHHHHRRGGTYQNADDDNSMEDYERPHYHRHHKQQPQRISQSQHQMSLGDSTSMNISTENQVIHRPQDITRTTSLARTHDMETTAATATTTNANDSSAIDVDRPITTKKTSLKRKCIIKTDMKETKASLLQQRLSLLNKVDSLSGNNNIAADVEDTSGGMNSGSEGGYSASYSSNGDSCAADYYDSCNNSLNNDNYDYNYDYDDEDDSDDENDQGQLGKHRRQHQQRNHQSGDPTRPMLSSKKMKTNNDRQDSLSISSELADFSSTFTSNNDVRKQSTTRSQSPSLTSSSSNVDESDVAIDKVRKEEKPHHRRRRRRRTAPVFAVMSQHSPTSMIVGINNQVRGMKRTGTGTCKEDYDTKPPAIDRSKVSKTLDGKIPIMTLDCDVLAHVLTFLEPPEVLDVLTMPLSKTWLSHYTSQPELWRVLCQLEPFKAQVHDEYDDNTGISSSSSSSDDDSIFLHSLSTKRSAKFRLLYASYVRCMRCLARIKEDVVSGKPPSIVDYAAVFEESGLLAGTNNNIKNFGSNQNLQQFLSRARNYSTTTTSTDIASNPPVENIDLVAVPALDNCEEKCKDTKAIEGAASMNQSSHKKPKIKFGHSKLTQRLVGPSVTGLLGEVELPWSYGIYSIVNWMVAYFDVEGIQIMCLRVLPMLLENEQQRIIAQRTGLTDIVLRVMVLYPESITLHTAAFHTIVLLARPLGGQEGMLFHTSMVNSSGIFGSNAENSVGGKSGIAVLIDSMRRFANNEALQSMACWSLVNIALAPAQKEVLVKLGGIDVIAQAMVNHQYSAEVQFRALFSLINLVIPSVPNSNDSSVNLVNQDLGIDVTEREMLDEMVDQIISLVVLSMKNFCSNEAILNRACLVLHNLSLSTCYHSAMLWTPNCYQILEWCLGNYRSDQVLQQSAAGTLHRLQTTLSRDETLRIRFTAKLHAKQKESIDRAKQDAIRFNEIQQQQQTVEVAGLSQQFS